MAEPDISLQLSPSEIFKRLTPQEIPQLQRTPKDTFYVIPAKSYVAKVKEELKKSKVNGETVYYLNSVIDFISGKLKEDKLSQVFETRKTKIDVNAVRKYFGEILGPIYLMTKDTKIKNIVFPLRSNYELFDFFTSDGKVHTGYSSKIEGGTSNTLSPKIIFDRTSKLKAKTDKEKLTIEILKAFSTKPTFQGIVEAVGELVKRDIFPTNFDATLKKSWKKVNFQKDGMILEGSKTQTINKLQLSNGEAYKSYIDSHVLPKSKTIPGNVQRQYITGSKYYTSTNVVYALGKFIVDVNSNNSFDISPVVKAVFQDLNVVKLDLNGQGIVKFKVENVSKSKASYKLRSKHRWDTIKDKLGIQL